MTKPFDTSVNKLTTAQKDALSQLKSFIQNDKSDFNERSFVSEGAHRFFRLSGYAGTGKSFSICHLMEWLRSSEIEFVAAAPTNKAAKNLAQLAMSIGISLDVKTIAQLLGQQPEINQETGKEEFTSTGEANFDDYEVVIIDEFSMINRSNFEEIVKATNLTINTKVIFVGDAAQLPPVKEQVPIVAVTDCIDRVATLTEIVRYEGEIAVVAEQIRSSSQYNRRLYPFKSTKDRTIVCQRRKQWLQTVAQYFKSNEYQIDPDYARLLVWRNKTAKAANTFVRSRLWGKDAPLYVPGDRLIARKPLFRSRPGQKGKNKWGIIINNSEECSVIDKPALEQRIFDREEYQYWSVLVLTDNGIEILLSILTAESDLQKQAKAQYYIDKKQWNRYFDLSRMFDDVTYAYALTVHKAQGSSIDNVFLDTEDLQFCPDLQKMLYTALTRTKVTAFIPLK